VRARRRILAGEDRSGLAHDNDHSPRNVYVQPSPHPRARICCRALMKLAEYQDLYSKLETAEDIDFLAENAGYDRELLLVIHTQRVVRDTTKRFYRVKDQVRRLAHQWRSGQSFVEIARNIAFPPTLTALMILEQQKVPRKQFWRYITDPTKVGDPKLRRELEEVARADIIYSPEGSAKQYERGRWGESKLFAWLDERAIEYRTEKDLRKQYEKTPDTLLKTPIEWDGSKKFWIESKATFGDPVEIRRHIRKQLLPYTDMFGDGLVVYWFGYTEDVDHRPPEGVTIADGSAFDEGGEISVAVPKLAPEVVTVRPASDRVP